MFIIKISKDNLRLLYISEGFSKTKGVFMMSNKNEKKRQKLINKLIFFNVYKKEDQKLYMLPLTKLENEYKKYKIQNHPHGEFGSIQWV